MKVTVLFFVILVNICFGQDSSKVELQKINENLYQLSNIIIDVENGTLKMPGKVNMNSGLIEVFASASFGKLHESLLVIDIVPYYLQVSLLLLGLNPTEFSEYYLNNQKADEVEIFVEWEEGGKNYSYRAEDLILNAKEKTHMKYTNWVFIGSKIINGRFTADESRSLITTYNDPYTIIDNPLSDGKNDEVYFVNDKLVPPKNTNINLIIKKIL